ncbi:DUF3376 domain-containing protein [Paenibacillus montanisoli]|uniref:PNPLA domain-containing protein n=1 Tax=Paenibacillus montanisoli TaxID=2081970 RepID=A0A328U7R9_9BACL|nr:DUF3376 domain-containing protein [Paenibacillus montanisoli]RAP78520.1 hypothetical protein DL346_08895 [Paenibacillus montanisoli]
MNLTKEIRLAIVMYGGVSLSVYMNGVVQELLMATRARKGDPSDAENNPYTDLLKQMNAEIAIDIIAGNSAGGINAVLLAKALATGADLNVEEIKDLWRDAANLQTLLDFHGKKPDTLLNGEFIFGKLKECFRIMDEQTGRDTPNKIASNRRDKVSILDLFVAASDIKGRRWGVKDDKGNDIKGYTHDVMFQKKYRKKYGPNAERGYDQNDFSEDKNDALSRISRATSAIPTVFPEESFTNAEVYAGKTNYDNRDEVYLHDGLLTDNKPFAPVLNALFHRSADSKVDRWLLFLDPVPPESFADHYDKAPTIMEAATSLVSIPRYQSIYKHLKAIEDRQEQVEAVIKAFDGIDLADGTADAEKMPSFLPYCSLRESQWKKSLVGNLRTYMHHYSADGKLIPADHPALELFKSFEVDRITNGDLAALIADNWLPDIAFCVHFFHSHIQKINRKLQDIPDEDSRLPTLLKEKNRLWEIVEELRQLEWTWWNDEEDKKKLDPPKPYHPLLAEAIKRFYLRQETLEAAYIVDYMRQSLNGYLERLQKDGFVVSEIGDLKKAMRGFLSLDVFLFPLSIGREGELSRIELLRISASDTKTIEMNGNDKLVGNDLGAFASFLNRKWRVSDMMWGRMDTADILIEHLYQSYKNNATDSEAWKARGMRARAERLLAIAEEELPYVDKELYAKFRERKLHGKPPEEQIKQIKQFFESEYKVGKESWKDLRFAVKAKIIAAGIDNYLIALSRYAHNSNKGIFIRVTIGTLRVAAAIFKGVTRLL